MWLLLFLYEKYPMIPNTLYLYIYKVFLLNRKFSDFNGIKMIEPIQKPFCQLGDFYLI